jgi:hypothetical protein
VANAHKRGADLQLTFNAVIALTGDAFDALLPP